MENNGLYNPVQLNETVERANDGTILRTNLMLNIRSESPEEAVSLYREVKEMLNGKFEQNESISIKRSEAPICPSCKIQMQLKSNSKNGNKFFGCPNWKPKGKGCNQTIPCVTEEETVEALPF